MTAHLYECPSEPNQGIRIETPATVQTWLPGDPVIPGGVWCWTHQQWEAAAEEGAE